MYSEENKDELNAQTNDKSNNENKDDLGNFIDTEQLTNWNTNQDNVTNEIESNELLDKISKLEEELAQSNDKMLRATAEAQNIRKRAEKEVAETQVFTISRFAKELLSVLDNLRRALNSIDENERKEDEKLNQFAIGIEMTEKEMLKVFERFQIKEIETKDLTFDPNLHEVLFEVPNADVQSGTILDVIESGWTVADKLIRPAKVGVAKEIEA